MRIVAGAWRGRALVAPPGQGTRPTADRVRQALFDMIMHADWGGRSVIDGASVLDVFAGTGALGLEALSRGAARVQFVESDTLALRALRTNIAACKAQDRSHIVAVDAIGLSLPSNAIPKANPEGHNASVGGDNGGTATLVFLDPPYGQDLVPRALVRLQQADYIGENALIVAETARDETWVPEQPLLAERQYGAARILIFRRA